jgi:deoxyribonuclease V
VNVARAIRIQERLASRVALRWSGGLISCVGGADFGYDPTGRKIGAVIVVMKVPGGQVVEVARAVRNVTFPYIPGLLAFREGPAFCQAFRKLKHRPDVTLLDGNGIAHPRKMGLASYVGVILAVPTIGCAKRASFPFSMPSQRKGAFTVLRNENMEKIGLCLRTRAGVKPIFVSPGHGVDFRLSRQTVLDCSRFRIPEPLREAHRLSRTLFRT